MTPDRRMPMPDMWPRRETEAARLRDAGRRGGDDLVDRRVPRRKDLDVVVPGLGNDDRERV